MGDRKYSNWMVDYELARIQEGFKQAQALNHFIGADPIQPLTPEESVNKKLLLLC